MDSLRADLEEVRLSDPIIHNSLRLYESGMCDYVTALETAVLAHHKMNSSLQSIVRDLLLNQTPKLRIIP